MPAAKVCNVPGCPTLTKAGRCDQHRRAADLVRGSSTARGWTRTWAAFRRTYLTQHPTCTAVGCAEPATDIDHIDGTGRNGARATDPTNLRAYCHSHHSQRTARDQPGGFRLQ